MVEKRYFLQIDKYMNLRLNYTSNQVLVFLEFQVLENKKIQVEIGQYIHLCMLTHLWLGKNLIWLHNQYKCH